MGARAEKFFDKTRSPPLSSTAVGVGSQSRFGFRETASHARSSARRSARGTNSIMLSSRENAQTHQ